MDGYPCPEGMSPEQYAQAQRIMEVTEDAFREERWRMACLLASKQDHELFGRTEFEVRDHVHRMGAGALQAAANERRKKGAITDAVLHASGSRRASPASITPSFIRGERYISCRIRGWRY